MNDRNYEGPPIDGTEQYISEADGVEYATDVEENGEMMTQNWPKNATPKDELKEDHIEIIKTAVNHLTTAKSLSEILRIADVDRQSGYASYVLREHWPKGHEKIKSQRPDITVNGGSETACGDTHQHQLNPDELAEVRMRRLKGESTSDIADDYGVSKSAALGWLNGNKSSSIEQECSVPPLRHGELPAGYKLQDGDVVKVGDQQAHHQENGNVVKSDTANSYKNDESNNVEQKDSIWKSAIPAFIIGVVLGIIFGGGGDG